MNAAWKRVCKDRGLRYQVSQKLNLTPGAVYAWDKVPAKHVKKVAKITGVPRESLRPDLYR